MVNIFSYLEKPKTVFLLKTIDAGIFVNSPYLTNIKRTFGVSQIQSLLTVNGGNTFSTIVFFSFVDPFFFCKRGFNWFRFHFSKPI